MERMPTVKDVFDFIDSFAPFASQCEWDNSGLLVGDPRSAVKKIGVVLDITPEAVEFAAKNGANLIVSHHPVIFKPKKAVMRGDPVYYLIEKGISAVCAHTCLDLSPDGVNSALAGALGFENPRPLDFEGEAAAILTVEIPETSGEALAKRVAERLNAVVRLADGGKTIKTVALCGGSGGDFIDAVAAAGLDAYITGELSRHDFLDGLAQNLTLIAAGHFETENPVVARLANALRRKFKTEVVEIPQASPIKFV